MVEFTPPYPKWRPVQVKQSPNFDSQLFWTSTTLKGVSLKKNRQTPSTQSEVASYIFSLHFYLFYQKRELLPPHPLLQSNTNRCCVIIAD